MKNKSITRRDFLAKAAVASAAGIVVPSLLTGCSSGPEKTIVTPTQWMDQAPDGPLIKAGVIGCGGRGTGAALNFLSAGPHLTISAVGDLFKDRMDSFRKRLKKDKQVEIPDENCFLGFDAFEKVIATDVDVVILATPPFFRPEHIAAAVAAKKHIFAEKPVCVDPVGVRSCIMSARNAAKLGLSIVTGTQRRHQRDYVEVYRHIQAGEIGEIVGGNVYWNQGRLWHKDPNPDWSEMECMIRDWVNWTWLSGDHIVEQHVHNIDVANWFMGAFPVKAVGFGSRQRRLTGNQYDNFSVDFTYEDGRHVHSMCRQIDGCANSISERMQGALGSTNCCNTVTGLKGEPIFSYEYPKDGEGKPSRGMMVNPYVQEHIDLVTAIRTGKPLNELETTAKSTMCAVMGRVSAYTGKEVTWDEMMNSDMKLGPKVFVMGKVDVPKDVPAPGKAFVPKK